MRFDETEFRAHLAEDRAKGAVRPLREYLDAFEGDDAALARIYLAEIGTPSSSTGTAAGDRIGVYKLIEELGRGGQGAVHLAEDTRLNRKVALKVLAHLSGAPGEVERFRREAELAGKLDHPGICAIYDADVFAGIPYIAMQYITGETLAARIGRARAGRLQTDDTFFMDVDDDTGSADGFATAPPAATTSQTTTPPRRDRPRILKIVALFEQAARALHEAHEAGIIHRDIKPGNIMVTKRGEPVLLDFGLARDVDGDDVSLTRSGDLFGTPAYMSPEQLMAQRVELDCRTDVYSLAVSLYEAITLERPFDSPNREALYQSIITQPAPDVRKHAPGTPPDLKVVLEKALEKNRDHRYVTALAFAEDLARVVADEPIAAQPIGRATRITRWARRRPYRAALLAVLLLVGLAAAVILTQLPGYLETRDRARTASAEADRKRRTAETNRHVDLGYRAWAMYRFDDAHRHFENALAVSPHDPEAVAGRAFAWIRQAQPRQAAAWLNARSTLTSEQPSLAELMREAQRRCGDPVPAAEALESRAPQDAFILAMLARMRAEDGDAAAVALAHRLMGRAMLLSEREPRLLYYSMRIEAAVRYGDFTVATACGDAIVKLWPDSAIAWHSRGIALANGTDVERLEETMRRSEALGMDPLSVQLMRGHIAVLKGDGARGLAIQAPLLEAHPRFTRVIENVATLHSLRGDEKSMLATLQAGIEHASDTLAEAKLRMWRASFFTEVRAPDALADLDRVVTLQPWNLRAISLQTLAATSAGEMGTRLRSIRHLAASAPNDGIAQFRLGSALLAFGRPDEAEPPLRRAAELLPEQPETHLELALALQEQGKLEAAIRANRTASRLSPADRRAWRRNAEMLRARGEFAAAMDEVERGLEPAPRDYILLNMLANLARVGNAFHRLAARREHARKSGTVVLQLFEGACLAAEQRFAEARDWLERLTDRGMNTAVVWENIGLFSLRLGDAKAAVDAFERSQALACGYSPGKRLAAALIDVDRAEDAAKLALRLLAPPDIVCVGQLNALQRLGRLGEGIDYLRKKVGSRPQDTPAATGLAWALVSYGRAEEALALTDKALMHAPFAASLRAMRGVILSRVGRYDDAIDAYRRTLAISPGDVGTMTNLCRACRELKRHEAFAAAARKLYELTPDIIPLIFLSQALPPCGKKEEAVRIAMDALDRSRESWRDLEALANVLIELGAAERLDEELRKTLAADPKNALVRCILGFSLMEAKKPEAAQAELRRAFNTEFEWLARCYLGNMLASQGELEAAVESFERAVASTPKIASQSFLNNYRLLLHRLGEHDEAVDVAKMLVKHFPGAESSSLLAAAFRLGGRHEEALDVLKVILRRHPTHIGAGAGVALALRALGRADEGLRLFEERLDQAPTSPFAHLHLAWALNCVGRDDDALAAIDDALAIHPGLHQAYGLRGQIHLRNRRFEPAIEDLKHLIEKNIGAWQEGMVQLYMALDRAGRFAEGAEVAGRLIAFDGTNMGAHLDHGIMLSKAGHRERAIRKFDFVLAPERRSLLSPTQVSQTLFVKGTALRRLGRFGAAIAILTQCIERAATSDGTKAEAWCEIAYCREAQGKMDDAESALKESAALAPAFFKPWLDLARLQQSRGNARAAIATLRRGMRATPRRNELMAELAKLLDGLGRKDEALRIYERSVLQNPQFVPLALWETVATRFVTAGKYDRAIVLYRAGLAEHPENGKLLAGLARVHRRSGQVDAAVRTGRRAIACDAPVADAFLGLAAIWGELGIYSEARDTLAAGLRAHPKNVAIALAFVELLLHPKRPESWSVADAWPVARRAVETSNRKNAKALAAAARVKFAMRQPVEAGKLQFEALTVLPSDAAERTKLETELARYRKAASSRR